MTSSLKIGKTQNADFYVLLKNIAKIKKIDEIESILPEIIEEAQKATLRFLPKKSKNITKKKRN